MPRRKIDFHEYYSGWSSPPECHEFSELQAIIARDYLWPQVAGLVRAETRPLMDEVEISSLAAAHHNYFANNSQ